jgi:hypothetical protein
MVTPRVSCFYTIPAGPGPLPRCRREALTRGVHALCCMQEHAQSYPRNHHLHCGLTTSVMMPEEGMAVMRLPVRSGVHPRLLLALAVLVLAGCQTAYYTALEKLGYPKRDLLVSRVQQARESQQAAKAQFQSALEHFRAVVNVRGGELEAKYNALSAELERSEARARTVHQRIAAVEEVAEALFKEWEAELAQYTQETLRRASARQLAQTRQRYTPLIRTMKRAEAQMAPVLAAFRDQVLFLKHNLNARAIASLRQEGVAVETEITALIRAMEAAIAEADAFLKTLDQGQGS